MGYDRDRFIDLEEWEAEEYVCGICRDIVKSPVVLFCCYQTYCQDCINQWLTHNPSCPNDRRRLSRNNMAPAPKLVLNLLKRLKIKCDYSADGCQNVCPLAKLRAHLRNECAFNPDRKCRDCGAIKSPTSAHNCIKTLTEQIKALKSQVERLNTALAQRDNDNHSSVMVDGQISELKKEITDITEANRTAIDRLTQNQYLLMRDMASIKEKGDFKEK